MRNMKRVVQMVYYRLKNRGNNIKFDNQAVILGKDSSFEGNNRIGSSSRFHGSMGFGSYIGSNCEIDGKIGRFCSIAGNVHVVIGNHPTNTFVSTHPAFFSTKKQAGFSFTNQQLFHESVYADDQNHQVLIGSDVWIGFGATILSGISIGDGAVIAAGSVVTKDVPPYAISGGVPAKIIRYRFEPDTIQFLLSDKWWAKDICWIERHSDLFTDIDQYRHFIEKGERL